jgi:hypothetical protein
MDDNDLVLAMLGLACALLLVSGLFLIAGDNRRPDIVKPAPTATAALGAKH